MLKARGSIAGTLTTMNMVVSGTAVVLACLAFFVYEAFSFRQNVLDDLSIQAQIIASNAASSLIFNDSASAEKTLSALQASPHIIFAGVYAPDGHFFAGYWRDQQAGKRSTPPISAAGAEAHQFTPRELALTQPIAFDGKTVGYVYIRSDLRALTARLETYLLILILILAASLLAALVTSRIARSGIAEPMIRLARVAHMVSRDKNYEVRADVAGNYEEAALLVGAFNEMLGAIHQREMTLQESERQFRTLADSLPQLAWIARPDGAIVWYNQRWYDYTGTTFGEMAGWGWQAVHDPTVLPEVLEKWRSAIGAGQRFEMVFPLRGRDGAFRDFLTLAIPVVDVDGKIVRWFGTNTDITEQRRSEDALRRSEKLAATGRLAASIAHEINNPLEAVTNLMYLARKNPSNVGAYLTMADQELDRIAEITRHTLGFYRDTSTPVRIDVSEVLRGVLALYDRKFRFKNIAVNRRFEEGIHVVGFPGEIRQIFANLVANAIEAMTEGGCLTLKASRAREWTDGRRGGIRVTVMDNGVGIDRSQMSRIFEPFYTTKKDVGTGLGLWLVQSLVRKHQGTIRVRSATGSTRHGTVFSVFLPEQAAEYPRPDNYTRREVEPSAAGK